MSSCFCESCPEAVQTINITQNTLEVDGAAAGFGDQYFHGGTADVGVGNTLTLSHTPLNAASVLVFLNSGVQGQDTGVPANNFTVSGAVVTLNFAPVAGDVVHVHYFWVV